MPARKKYVLALDEGTTSCRALLFDHEGQVAAVAQEEFAQHYPRPSWVEQDANEIWAAQKRVMEAAVASVEEGPETIAAIGITNQRETVVVWDRATGEPLHPAIVWQCRRSTEICERLRAAGTEPMVREKTGLLLDPYFSGTKLTWLFEEYPDLYRRAQAGEALFGTVDSWLLWKLTGGRVHATDVTNASRTLLFNLHTRDWDEELLALFGVPRAMLPEVRPSSGIFGETTLQGVTIPLAGVAGDQQAALFGQACFEPGMAKNTYGTGCFLLMNTGPVPPAPEHGLLATVAWEAAGEVAYALEGSVFVAGAAVQWLRDGLGLVEHAADTEAMARSVPDTGGVYFVPAFTGLGTPHWRPEARGMITGLTRGTRREHLARAALEAIAYQTREVCESLSLVSGLPLRALRVDGGAAVNDFLLQFQADMLHAEVARPAVTETTARGAAFLAGLAVGFWESRATLTNLWQPERTFHPQMLPAERDTLWQGWQKAVAYQAPPPPPTGEHYP